jgi:arginine decarboxylase
LESLVLALKDLSKRYYKVRNKLPKIDFGYQFPETYSRPREAYHAPKMSVPLADAAGEISAESIMIYPPGIPLVIPGEIISKDVVEDIEFYIKNGSVIHSDLDNGYIKIVDRLNWEKYEGENEDEF